MCRKLRVGIAPGRLPQWRNVALVAPCLPTRACRPGSDVTASPRVRRGFPFMLRLPSTTDGLRIGLLGGSFDPPHTGHLHISRWALRAIGLDKIWWLVSPGNPLKPNGPADLDRRVAACRSMIRDRRIVVSDIERHLGSPYTADTLAHLQHRAPGARFVWMMGADNLAEFHLWRNWRWIADSFDIAVFARPGQQVRAGLSPAARVYANRRLPPEAAGLLGRGAPGRWALLPGPMSDRSSTEIRAQGNWH